eukprot:CAMPEP_0171352692 /NCGR_PEP_ID=MMETSP0878-20121228/42313_1 /TAXON_ID=67004 /ORGANISM="Thalassiosira weissflogii, Strain CCMP1336" /LENGTH=50 /DNA_ID=CAMNT_0011858423 /DNA_START=80 /DNA_END=232 /DNA_ORIENTATION=+
MDGLLPFYNIIEDMGEPDSYNEDANKLIFPPKDHQPPSRSKIAPLSPSIL